MPISRDTDGDPANLTWWKTPEHQANARLYNNRWDEFLGPPTKRTREEVMKFAKELAEEFKDAGCGVLPERRMIKSSLQSLRISGIDDHWLHVDPVNIPPDINALDVLLGDATPGEPVACVWSSGADIGDFISTELFHVVLVSSRILDAWRAAADHSASGSRP